MSQSKFVTLDLDQPRQFRFTLSDSRDACRHLSNIPGKGNVDSLQLILMLARRDYDAWSVVLAEGLKGEEPNLKPDRALRYLQEALDKASDRNTVMANIAKGIRKAGELSGVWDTADEEADARGNESAEKVSTASL